MICGIYLPNISVEYYNGILLSNIHVEYLHV